MIDDSDTPEETTPITLHPTEDRTSQYSPSISHSEEVPNDEVEEWEATTNDKWSHDQDIESKEGDEDSEEWEDFGQDSGTSGVGVWGDSVTSVRTNDVISDPVSLRTPPSDPQPLRTSSSSGRMKLKRVASNTSSTQVTESATSSPDLRSSTNLSSVGSGGRTPGAATKQAGAEFRSSMKGRLSEEDIARLEAKSEWFDSP